MALRKTPLVNNQFYHVYNRTIDNKSIFVNIKTCQRVTFALYYYQFNNPPMKLSYFLTQSAEKKQQILNNLETNHSKMIHLLTYCLMPNHFHLEVRQLTDNGISKFLANIQNSVTHYFNTRSNRVGHLFEGQFKAVRIESEEELFHVHRYIHLNPYSGFVVKSIDKLFTYRWSSLDEYLTNKRGYCTKELILSRFKNSQKYLSFITNQADYQRKLDRIKHLILEESSFNQY